jgi:hypothetical protein
MAVVFAPETDDNSLRITSKGLFDIQYPELIVVAIGAWKQLCPNYDDLSSTIRNES